MPDTGVARVPYCRRIGVISSAGGAIIVHIDAGIGGGGEGGDGDPGGEGAGVGVVGFEFVGEGVFPGTGPPVHVCGGEEDVVAGALGMVSKI